MLEKHSNYHFYTNACHVCKQFGEGISLKRCGNCTMIAYCSKGHQRKHWPQHRDLCSIICNILNDNKLSNFLNYGDINIKKWTDMKMNFMLLVAMKIPRRLKHYEEQMFKFLRSCTVCHNRNPKELVDCLNCPAASFCVKHKNHAAHIKVCYMFKLCFKLDLALIMHEKKIPELKLPCRMNYMDLPGCIEDFIKQYVKEEMSLQLSIEEQTIINAEYLTRPLTCLYAMKKLKEFLWEDKIIIHIIAANMLEVSGINLWEILLHWLPKSTVVQIILIGPEVFPDPISINLCNHCQSNNKKLLIETHNVFYTNYFNNISNMKPNFIIGYNAGISECEDLKFGNDTWAQSLQIIADQHCPLILTSYTISEAMEEQARLKVVLNNNIKCSFLGHNPYSGLRPYRDFESEGVYYQNQYIIIYKTLSNHNYTC
ncbi:uncharacterized protein LOC116426664 [Nomia melanderi]|uniref:uncharacterized protein LOC116426664 n=1 Tax=Nomia melanderi TaxID=2448451 RepID=UPI0013043EE2|nr:uncharacterized protein LOC116426664 [Nomia melanderi]